MTLTFVSRPMRSQTEQNAPSVGHAYVIVGVKTNFGVKEEIFGFYPTTSGLGTIKGPGMLKAEERCGPNDDCNEKYKRRLLSRLSESTASVTIPIESDERQIFYKTVKKWDAQSRPDGDVQIVPRSSQEYRLADQNCIDFVAAALKDLNYSVPERSLLQTPTDFITELKPLIKQQLVMREQEARLKEFERRLENAERRTREAEERKEAAEKERDEALERAKQAERRRQAELAEQQRREQEVVPTGWIVCQCPSQHSGLGRLIRGARYHPRGPACP
ncbi:hypothetical protein [Sinorhizobium meliloti]|uniref:hypothetical protein n=1 Tax=Rhizobium meliloti TaxID=382 RepID=UPI0020BDC2E8|nr:hypothetical protein [Sinorhizobium meliloti]